MLNISKSQNQSTSHNALVPVGSVELGSGRNVPLSNIGEDSQVFWEEGKGSWVRFLCSLGSYPRSSGNGTLTIPSYRDNSFSSFSSLHAMFSALPSLFLPSLFMNIKCKENRGVQAKWCEQQWFPGTAAFHAAEKSPHL